MKPSYYCTHPKAEYWNTFLNEREVWFCEDCGKFINKPNKYVCNLDPFAVFVGTSWRTLQDIDVVSL